MIQGRRLPSTHWPDVLPASKGRSVQLRDGDYWLCHGHPSKNRGFDGSWFVCFGGYPGAIPDHFVEEHEDGTITIAQNAGGSSNSVLIQTTRDSQRVDIYHGFVDHGVWT